VVDRPLRLSAGAGVSWLVPFSEDDPDQKAGSFSLDGRLRLEQIVAQVANQSGAEFASPWVGVYEDDEAR
jgi:hypothetical protein